MDKNIEYTRRSLLPLKIRFKSILNFCLAVLISTLIVSIYFYSFLPGFRGFQFKFWPEITANMNDRNITNQIIAFTFLLALTMVISVLPKNIRQMKLFTKSIFIEKLAFTGYLWFCLSAVLIGLIARTFLTLSPDKSSSYWGSISNGHMTLISNGTLTPFADLIGPSECAIQDSSIKAGDFLSGCDPIGRDGPSIYPRFAYDYLRVVIPIFGINIFAFTTYFLLFATGLYLLRNSIAKSLLYFAILLSPAIALGIERANLSLFIVAFLWIGILALSIAKNSQKRHIRIILFIFGTLLVQSHIYLKLFPIIGIICLAIAELITRSNKKYFLIQLFFVLLVFITFPFEFYQTINLNSGQIDSSYSFGNSLIASSLNQIISGNPNSFFSSDNLLIFFIAFFILILLKHLIRLRFDLNLGNKSKENFGLYSKKDAIHLETILFFISPLIFSALRSVQYDYQLVMLLPIFASLLTSNLVSRNLSFGLSSGLIIFLFSTFYSRGFLIHNLTFFVALLILTLFVSRLLAEVLFTISSKQKISFWKK